MVESEQKNEIEAVDTESLVSGLERRELSQKLKIYLEKMRPIRADDTEKADKLREKRTVLRKISGVIVTMPRILSDDEKKFLFGYFKETIEGGERPKNIGFDDRFLAKLTLGNLGIALKDDEKAFNGEIVGFAERFEGKDGFFEETAAKIVELDTDLSDTLINRCNLLIKNSKNPKGIIFAAELINIKQVKPALDILTTLAQKGQATEITSLVHRLLPLAKEFEKQLLEVLKTNLMQQKQKPGSSSFAVFKEYITKLYVQAARSFAENRFFDCAATLLSLLVEQEWIDADSSSLGDFAALCNVVMIKCPQTAEVLKAVGQKIGLTIWENEGQTLLCEPGDESHKAAHCRLEQTIIGIDSLDEDSDKNAEAKDETELKAKVVKKDSVKADEKAENKKANSLKKVGDKLSSVKDKLGINNVLESKTKKIDKRFDKLKKATVSAIKVAGEQAVKVKQKVVDAAQLHKENSADEEKKPTKFNALVPVLNKALVVIKSPSKENEDEKDKKKEIEAEKNEPKPIVSTFYGDPFWEAEEATTTPDVVAVEPVTEDSDQKQEKFVSTFYDLPFEENGEDTQIPSYDEVEPVVSDNNTNAKVVSTFYERPFWEEDPDENKEVEKTAESTPSVNSVQNVGQPKPVAENEVKSVDATTVSALDDFVSQTTVTKADSIGDSEVTAEPHVQIGAKTEEIEVVQKPGGEETLLVKEFEKNKANLDGLMDVRPEELDNQLNQVKQPASSAVKQADEKVSLIKKRVADTNITASSSVSKIRNLAQKIKFFKK